MRHSIKTSLAAIITTAVLAPTLATPAMAAEELVSAPTSFQFNGAGWGHGVGMSQYGARGMAQAGKSATQILEHYYNPAKVTNETKYAESDIRVQVLHSATASMFVSGGKARIKDGSATRTASSSLSYSVKSGSLEYVVDGKKYTTKNKITVQWEGTRAWSSSKRAILSVQRANDGLGSVAYRHGFMSVAVLSGKVNVVNQLRLNDEYLYGLAEVPSSWETAALQSQAVAGRTYAMRNMSSTKSACDCNVYDEVVSQKFTAWNKENEGNGSLGNRWVSAVDQTLGRKSGEVTYAKVVKYNGSLIDAVYSSSTGGKTRAAKSVWGNEHAYLQSRDDSWALKASVNNPSASWSRTITQNQAKSGFGISNIATIKLASGPDLSVSSATATTMDGKTSTITGSKLRSLIGARAAWVLNSKAIGGTYKDVKLEYSNTAKGTKYQTTGNLNMREEPTSGQVIKVLAEGAEVSTAGKALKDGTWVQVTNGKDTGWVSKQYLELVQAKAPVVVKPKPAAPKPATPKPVVPKPAPKPKPTPAPPKTVTKKVTTHTVSTGLNLRTAAVNGKIIATMKKGQTVALTGKSANKGSWIQVKYGNKTGWASKKYIKSTTKTVTTVTGKNSTTTKPKATTKITKTTTERLNLRNGASTKNKVITVIPKGVKVTLAGKQNAAWWVKVNYGNKSGYVSATYLK